MRLHTCPVASRSSVTQTAAWAWCLICSTLYLKPLHILSTTQCLMSAHAHRHRSNSSAASSPAPGQHSTVPCTCLGALPSNTLCNGLLYIH